MKKMLIGVGMLMVLYSCKNMGGSPKSVVSSFIDAAKTGNIDAVKKYITKSDVGLIEIGETFMAKFDTAHSAEMKAKMAKEFSEKTKDANVEIKDEKINGDSSTVDVQFTHDGKTETHPFSLIKEDGQWKISLISTGLKSAGVNGGDLKNFNGDSIKAAITKGMESFKNMDKDSLQKVMQEGMTEYNKVGKDSIQKMMREGMKQFKKIGKDSMNKIMENAMKAVQNITDTVKTH